MVDVHALRRHDRREHPSDMDSRRKVLLDELPRLRRYARMLVGDPAYADDLVQDCLVRAISNLDRWQEGTNMRAWLFTIMRNVLFNDMRRARRSPFLETSGDQMDTVPVSADQEQRMRVMDVDKAFARLAPAHKEVFLLIAVEGLDYEEAAHVLGVPVGTVKSRLSRARNDLRGYLDKADRPQPVERLRRGA